MSLLPDEVKLVIAIAFASALAMAILGSLPRAWFSSQAASMVEEAAQGKLRRQRMWPGILIVLAVCISLGLVAYGFIASSGIPGLLQFAAMIAGILAKWILDGVEIRKAGAELPLDLYGLIAPLVVSPIIFAAVLALARTSSSGIDIVFMSFQNGFFWKTVLKRGNPA